MNAVQFSDALGKVNDKYIMEAVVCGRNKKRVWRKWGTLAACFCLVLTAVLTVLPGMMQEPGGIEPPPNPDPVVRTDGDQSSAEPLQPPEEMEIRINWENVFVNESAGLAPDAALLYRDPALYETELWGQEEIEEYYGRELNVPYIPEGLTGGGKAVTAAVCWEKATGKIVQDQAGRGFWSDFWEDGSPKSDDDIIIPKGFTITVSKLGIFHCALLPVDEAHTTDFGGVSVILSHCTMKHGPFDPTQKDPDGLSNRPAGYYDIYVASFTLDGVEYEIEAQRLELEEVIKITASVINIPYSEDFAVGYSQNLPGKGSAPGEYPDTVIVPGFDLDEPDEPAVS